MASGRVDGNGDRRRRPPDNGTGATCTRNMWSRQWRVRRTPALSITRTGTRTVRRPRSRRRDSCRTIRTCSRPCRDSRRPTRSTSTTRRSRNSTRPSWTRRTRRRSASAGRSVRRRLSSWPLCRFLNRIRRRRCSRVYVARSSGFGAARASYYDMYARVLSRR